jgi:hypothetical protein
MRPLRMLLATAGVAALMVGGCGAAQANGSSVFVQVSPGTVSPGGTVKITALCSDNSDSATVNSIVFGTMTLQAQHTLLVARVTIPSDAATGTFSVDLTCRSGSTATTTLTITVSNAMQTAAPATVGPHTGGGFLAGAGGQSRAPAVWIVGGLTAIGAAIGIGTVTNRRRRSPARAPVRRR